MAKYKRALLFNGLALLLSCHRKKRALKQGDHEASILFNSRSPSEEKALNREYNFKKKRKEKQLLKNPNKNKKITIIR